MKTNVVQGRGYDIVMHLADWIVANRSSPLRQNGIARLLCPPVICRLLPTRTETAVQSTAVFMLHISYKEWFREVERNYATAAIARKIFKTTILYFVFLAANLKQDVLELPFSNLHNKLYIIYYFSVSLKFTYRVQRCS